MRLDSLIDGVLGWFSTDPGKAVIAGGLGGLIRWITLRHSLKEGILTILVGAICANYLGPLVVPVFENTLGKVVPVEGLGYFLVGMGGLSLTGMILDRMERARLEKMGAEEDESRD